MKNFRINKKQANTLISLAGFTEDDDVVINAESYDPDEHSFEFAIKIRETVHESVWLEVAKDMDRKGWSFYFMDEDGECEAIGEDER